MRTIFALRVSQLKRLVISSMTSEHDNEEIGTELHCVLEPLFLDEIRKLEAAGLSEGRVGNVKDSVSKACVHEGVVK